MMLFGKKNPCNICIVNPCCNKGCEEFTEWKARWDWLIRPFIIPFIIPVAFVIGVIVGLLEIIKKDEIEELEYYH